LDLAELARGARKQIAGGNCCCVAGTRPGLYATEVNIQNFNFVQAPVLKFVQPLIHGVVLAREPDVTNLATLAKDHHTSPAGGDDGRLLPHRGDAASPERRDHSVNREPEMEKTNRTK
jgi:hypothetical protein